jgi:hypothetical protein
VSTGPKCWSLRRPDRQSNVDQSEADMKMMLLALGVLTFFSLCGVVAFVLWARAGGDHSTWMGALPETVRG